QGTYTFTCIVTDNCGVTCSSSVTITVGGLPAVSVSPNSSLICTPTGSAVTLTATNGVSYTWSPSLGLSGSTGSTVSANPLSTTTYTVTATNASGCTNTSTATVTIGANPYIAIN